MTATLNRALPAVAVALCCVSLAHAQTDVLIEIDRGRMEGLFTKFPVFQRAILAKQLGNESTGGECDV
jgi:hypothetical protein